MSFDLNNGHVFFCALKAQARRKYFHMHPKIYTKRIFDAGLLIIVKNWKLVKFQTSYLGKYCTSI